jgi:preprotein translocase subunit YajC
MNDTNIKQVKAKKRLYLIGIILGLLIVTGIYEFIQYRQAKQQEEQVQQIVEQMQKQGLKVSISENGVITVRPK